MLSHPRDSNSRPMLYESIALPAELGWPLPFSGAVIYMNLGEESKLIVTSLYMFSVNSMECENSRNHLYEKYDNTTHSFIGIDHLWAR